MNIFFNLSWLAQSLSTCYLRALAGILNLVMRDLMLICNLLLIGKASVLGGEDMDLIIMAKAFGIPPLISCLLRGVLGLRSSMVC